MKNTGGTVFHPWPDEIGLMRILFLSHYFPREVSAPATRAYEHCVRWAQAGHEVEVTVVTCSPNCPGGIVYDGYGVHHVCANFFVYHHQVPSRAGVAEDHGSTSGSADVCVRRVLDYFFEFPHSDDTIKTYFLSPKHV